MSNVIFSKNVTNLVIRNKTGVFNAYKMLRLAHKDYNYDIADSEYYYVPSIDEIVTFARGPKAKIMTKSYNKAQNFMVYSLGVRSKIDERQYRKSVSVPVRDILSSARLQLIG